MAAGGYGEIFDFVIKLIGYGALGLGALLAVLAAGLLYAEQRNKKRSQNMIRAIMNFMMFSICLFVIGIAGDVGKYYFNGTPGILPEKADCGQLKSANGFVLTSTDFVNETNNVIKVYWISQGCVLEYWTDIDVGGHFEQSKSYFGHRWLVTDANDQPIAVYTVTAPNMRILIKKQ